MTIHEALWDYPLSVVLQMIHAKSTLEGNDYMWTNAGEASEESMAEFDRLSDISIEELLT